MGAAYIYSLTTHGAVRLEEVEERFSLSLSAERSKVGDLSVIHSVELNNIQLRAQRADLLVRWIREAEIRSKNELDGLSDKKDDAVVTLKVGGRDVTFALKYERTSKSRERYDKNRGECLRRAGGGSVRLSDGQRTFAQVRFLVLSRCEALRGIRLGGRLASAVARHASVQLEGKRVPATQDPVRVMGCLSTYGSAQ